MLVIIPAHNEPTILELVKSVKHVLPAANVLVVDDGSTDNTAHMAKVAGAKVLTNPPGSEYGDGFFAGLQYALEENDFPIVFMDAGLSHMATDIPKLFEELSCGYLDPTFVPRTDIVIGSRIVAGAHYHQRWGRKLITWVGVRVLAFAMKSGPIDYSSFRAIGDREIAMRLLAEAVNVRSMKAHSFNLGLLIRIRKKFRLKQVPITYWGTNSTLNVRRFVDAVVTLARR